MKNAPHVNAAFINALAEEGTRDELINSLQREWNKNCAYRHIIQDQLKFLETCFDTWMDREHLEKQIDKLAESLK